ncbi:MAG: monovalent cation/H(+) antiporter subunit G [Desulfuromonadaceae bacterium]|nr:monovalent cation/H(+) antiporter subunit G [Desulfuromonadaceae bacterium]
MTIPDFITAFCLILGALLGLTGGVGVYRLPDFFTRLHACSVTDSACAFLILSGLMFQTGFSLATIKLFFILVFLLITSPTSTHALAKAALNSGEIPWCQSQKER